MSILEYDEEEREKARLQEREYGIEEGRAIGIEEGKAALLKELVQKKLAKGKSAEVIAEELEVDLSKVEEIIRQG